MSLFSFFINAFILVVLAYEARTMFGLWEYAKTQDDADRRELSKLWGNFSDNMSLIHRHLPSYRMKFPMMTLLISFFEVGVSFIQNLWGNSSISTFSMVFLLLFSSRGTGYANELARRKHKDDLRWSILSALKECPIRDRSLYPHAQLVSLMNEGLIEPYGTGYRLTENGKSYVSVRYLTR